VKRVAYIDPVGGLAGDMLLAALLDVGAPRAVLDDTVRALGIHDVGLDVRVVSPSGIAATQVNLSTTVGHSRPASEMRSSIQGADLPEAVRQRSLDALDRLIGAEATVHGVDASAVVLHELGDDDTLVDICGAFALLDALSVELVVCAPLPMGRGVVEGDHGWMPAPAPATLALLHGVPVVGVPTQGELVTPTGAAIAVTAAASFGELPAMTVDAVGVGAGTREHIDRPNILRIVVGDASAGSEQDLPEVVVLEANVDDLMPELVPDVIDACLIAGAIDAWTVPIQMKKARPGLLLSVLARPHDERRLAETLLRHSSTLGVRVRRHARYELDRAIREVEVEGHPIRIKVGLLSGRVVNVAPEHDDCAEVAAASGRPVKQIWAEALAAATVVMPEAVPEDADEHAR
jgi:pyridinium-3,5-bisthiocarboxylic acid mononucleotide nickel chelatase